VIPRRRATASAALDDRTAALGDRNAALGYRPGAKWVIEL
jgi:hypothetical protein